MLQFDPVPPAPGSNAAQQFVAQEARQAIALPNAARVRATRGRKLLGLRWVVRRAQVNHLVKPLAHVRVAAHLLRSQMERCAARLVVDR
jgi:hypothetical protein